MRSQAPASAPRLVLATHNQVKLVELRRLLATPSRVLVSLEELGYPGEIDEVATTYEGNALLKASAGSRFSGLPAIGEDSGLEVAGLCFPEGRPFPGLHSRRWMGPAATEADRNQALLDLARRLPEALRAARFVTALTWVARGHAPVTVMGECAGRIVEPRGSGAAYDPIFEVAATGRTLAEMSIAERLRVSHRGEAVRKLEAAGVLPPRGRDGLQ